MSKPRNVPAGPGVRRGRAVDAVLADERPYTARSVLASTLLGIDPPRLPARLLVHTGELFGIAEGTVRVAVSRMLSAGELVADDGHYRLSGSLLDRQARQSRSRSGRTEPWDGNWRVEVVIADTGRTAGERAELRTAMAALRFAEWREGVWLRPDNLRVAAERRGGQLPRASATDSETATESESATQSATETETETETATATQSETGTATQSTPATESASASASASESESESESESATGTATVTESATQSETESAPATESASAAESESESESESATGTATVTESATQSETESASATESAPTSESESESATGTATGTESATGAPHVDHAAAEAEQTLRAQCRELLSQPADDPATLAADLWDLNAWAARARLLQGALGELVDALEAGDAAALSPGFVVSAAALRHFQADPLLPAKLLPDNWPGTALRADYERYDRAFKTTWSTNFRAP